MPIVENIYGSDQQGLIWGYRFVQGGSAAPLSCAEAVELLQQELAAQVNEQTNRTLFVLTAVTVLALPVNMVAGLFGMNVGGIPLANHAHGFFFIAGVLFTLTAFLAYAVFGRWRK